MLSSRSNGISHFSPFLSRNPSNPSSSFSLNNNNINVDNHHHHDQDLLSYYLSVAPIIETAAANNKLTPVVSTKINHTKKTPQNSSLISQECRRAKARRTAKRDRHSKIFTAQGPRDRRVRLSIEISRKFFGLQDLLGFDKASLTLDWLLTKSKTAIRELVETKQLDYDDNDDGGDANIARCLRTLSEKDEEEIQGDEEEEGDKNNNSDEYSEKTDSSSSKRKRSRGKIKLPKTMTESDRLAKESRAKARERARERTTEKNSLRQEQLKLSFLPDSFNANYPAAAPSSQTRPGLTSWCGINNGSCNSPESSKQSTVSSLNENSPVAAAAAEGFFLINPRISSTDVSTTVEELFLQQYGGGSIKRSHNLVKPACSSSNFGFHIGPSFVNREAINSSDFNIWPSAANDHAL